MSVVEGLLVVTVASAGRRIDLALPSTVPVADLLPDLAERLGLLDADRAHEGHRLLTSTGRLLAPAEGLAAQEVEDGAVLALLPGWGRDPAPVHDDPAEALAEVVVQDVSPVPAGVLRRTTSAVGCLLCGLGVAVATTTQLGGSVWACAGIGAAATGLASLATGGGRLLTAPPLAVGAVWLVAGVVVGRSGWEPARVLATTLVLAVLGGSALPSLAVTAGGLSAERERVDLDIVAAGARRARELLRSGLIVEGLLVVTLAPFVAGVGPWGVALAVACCVAVLLRARRHRSGAEALVGLAAGAAGLLGVAAAGLWLHPGWRLPGAVSLCLVGVVVIVAGVRSWPSPSRRGRLADVAETVARLSLLPLLVPACGVLPLVRDLVP